jgi:hypothetical protein
MTIADDVYAPRCEEERFRIYARAGGELTLLATAGTPQALGLALMTQDEDCRAAGLRGIIDIGAIGVLDAVESRWIVMPFHRGER